MKKALSLLMVFLVAVMWSAPSLGAEKYVSGNIGISWMNDADLDSVDDDDRGVDVDFSSGITLLGALGCDYGDYRLEGELGYQRNDVDSASLSHGEDRSVDLDGHITVLSLLVNGYYDIDLGSGVELSPTVGVGVAQVRADDVEFDNQSNDDGWSASEVTFAYQAGIGLGIPVSDGIMIDARYRYFGTTDFTFELAPFQFNTHINSHNALLGMRVEF